MIARCPGQLAELDAPVRVGRELDVELHVATSDA